MASTGNCIAVTGAKGGVGKTTTSINLCATLAAAGVETVLVEFDLAMANIVDFLTFGSTGEPEPTMHDVLAGEAPIEEATYEVADNFDLLPSGTSLDGYAKTDLGLASDVIAELQEQYELVVFDTGAGLNSATVTPIQLADGVVLVSTPRVASIRDADKTRTLADRVDTDVLGLVLTKSGTGNAPDADRIADFLDTRLLGHVPEDEAVPASQDQGRPVVQSEPDSAAGQMYQQIGRALGVGLALVDPSPSNPVSETTSQPGAKVVGDGGIQTDFVSSDGRTEEPSAETTDVPEDTTDSDQKHSTAASERVTRDETRLPVDEATPRRPVAVRKRRQTAEEETASSPDETAPTRKQERDRTDDPVASAESDSSPSSEPSESAQPASADPETDGDASTSDENESTPADESSMLSRFLNVLR